MAPDYPAQAADIIELASLGMSHIEVESTYVGMGTSAVVLEVGGLAVKCFDFRRVAFPDDRGRSSGLNAVRVGVMVQVGLQRLEDLGHVNDQGVSYVAPTMYGCYFPHNLNVGPTWIMSLESGAAESTISELEQLGLPNEDVRKDHLKSALAQTGAKRLLRAVDMDSHDRNWLIRDSGKTLVKLDCMIKMNMENYSAWSDKKHGGDFYS